jgi:hypothetical protein
MEVDDGGEKAWIDVSGTVAGCLSLFIPPFVLARGDNIGLVVAVGLLFRLFALSSLSHPLLPFLLICLICRLANPSSTRSLRTTGTTIRSLQVAGGNPGSAFGRRLSRLWIRWTCSIMS